MQVYFLQGNSEPSGVSNMLTNNFWEGFLMGAALVFGIFFLNNVLARARAKNSPNSRTAKQP
jgi:hypothetical protein